MDLVWTDLGIVLVYLAAGLFFLSKVGNHRWDQTGVRIFSVFFPIMAVVFTVVMLLNLHAAIGR